MVSATEL